MSMSSNNTTLHHPKHHMYFAEEAALKQRHSEWHRSDPEFQRERHLALLQEAHRSHHVLKKEEKSSQIVRKECLPLNGLPEEHSVADTLIAFSKHLRDDWRYDDEDDDDHDGSDGVSDNATHVSEGETVWEDMVPNTELEPSRSPSHSVSSYSSASSRDVDLDISRMHTPEGPPIPRPWWWGSSSTWSASGTGLGLPVSRPQAPIEGVVPTPPSLTFIDPSVSSAYFPSQKQDKDWAGRVARKLTLRKKKKHSAEDRTEL